MKEEAAPKIGAGHAEAMARLGLHELRAAFYPESNVAQRSEYGLYGTQTPGEVAKSRQDGVRDSEQDRDSALAERMPGPGQEREEQARDAKEPARE